MPRARKSNLDWTGGRGLYRGIGAISDEAVSKIAATLNDRGRSKLESPEGRQAFIDRLRRVKVAYLAGRPLEQDRPRSADRKAALDQLGAALAALSAAAADLDQLTLRGLWERLDGRPLDPLPPDADSMAHIRDGIARANMQEAGAALWARFLSDVATAKAAADAERDSLPREFGAPRNDTLRTALGDLVEVWVSFCERSGAAVPSDQPLLTISNSALVIFLSSPHVKRFLASASARLLKIDKPEFLKAISAMTAG